MRQRILILSAAIFAGGLLVIPAWPRFVGGAIVAPYEDTMREIARGHKIGKSVLAETETALDVGQKWFDSGKLSNSLGGLRFVTAQSAKTAADQRVALSDSIATLKNGLMQSPAQPYAWLLLAQAERARYGATASFGKYLSLSMRLAPWEHRLIMPRLELALGAWPALSPEFKSKLPGQFERAIDTAPVALARAARQKFALRVVRQMLAASPVHLERFLIVYLSPD